MFAFFVTLIALAQPAAPAAKPQPQSSQALHCRIEIAAGAKGKRCHVTLPPGRQVRPCADADRRPGHCDARAGRGRYVAWVVGTGPGHCRITKKKTKWDRKISAKLSKSEGAPSTCDLYVELR